MKVALLFDHLIISEGTSTNVLKVHNNNITISYFETNLVDVNLNLSASEGYMIEKTMEEVLSEVISEEDLLKLIYNKRKTNGEQN